jgi:hypothetical protein
LKQSIKYFHEQIEAGERPRLRISNNKKAYAHQVTRATIDDTVAGIPG